MKSLATQICIGAWTLALVVQSIVVSLAPTSLIVSGIDIAYANKMVLVHTLIVAVIGLALAVASYFAKSWGQLLAVLSSALYLVRWFPFKSVFKFGLSTVAKGMFLIGSNANFALLSIIGNVVLPALFISVITLVLLQRWRGASANAV